MGRRGKQLSSGLGQDVCLAQMRFGICLHKVRPNITDHWIVNSRLAVNSSKSCWMLGKFGCTI